MILAFIFKIAELKPFINASFLLNIQQCLYFFVQLRLTITHAFLKVYLYSKTNYTIE